MAYASNLMTVGQYICRIRNTNKREYAIAYLKWMRQGENDSEHRGPEPAYQCSYMAAQSVRMELYKLVGND